MLKISQLCKISGLCKYVDLNTHQIAFKASSVSSFVNKRRPLLTEHHQLPSSTCPWHSDQSRFYHGLSSRIIKLKDLGKAAYGHQQVDCASTESGTDQSAVGPPSVVYIGTLARMVRFVKLFSLTSSLVGISVQPYIYQNMSQLPVVLAACVGGFMGFFILITPLILHIVTKRYVTQITLDRSTGQYTATTYSFFLTEKHLKFTARDVKVPTVPGLFTTVVVNDKVPLFVDHSLFVDREAFLQMMKYDEPLEWEIDSPPEEEETPTTRTKEQQNATRR